MEIKISKLLLIKLVGKCGLTFAGKRVCITVYFWLFQHVGVMGHLRKS